MGPVPYTSIDYAVVYLDVFQQSIIFDINVLKENIQEVLSPKFQISMTGICKCHLNLNKIYTSYMS